MFDETRIQAWIEILQRVAKAGGAAELTHIFPNAEVMDDAPPDLSADYILVKGEEGYHIPAVKVSGLTVSVGDFVNLLYIEGTEAMAFQHGSASGGGGGGGGHIIQEEGVSLTARKYLNFVGDGVTATDDAVNDQTDVAVHDPVTLDADADTVLSLATQEIGLDVQAANEVFAGPIAGAPDVPAFRALNVADIAGVGMEVNQTVTPAPDGAETEFTVAGSEYAAGTLFITVNGQVQTGGVDFVETDPATGTFTFQAGSIPETGDTIRAFFGLLAAPGGVTLAADADVLLGLAVQQITLDSQAANSVFAGPAAGAATDPTFRALVLADMPAGAGWPFSDVLTVDPTDSDADYSTISDAMVAAVSGQAVFIGAGTYTEDVTVPDGVHLIGAGTFSTIILGSLTLGDGSSASLLTVICSTTNNTNATALTVPASHEADIFGVMAQAYVEGGTAYAARVYGTLNVRASWLEATKSGTHTVDVVATKDNGFGSSDPTLNGGGAWMLNIGTALSGNICHMIAYWDLAGIPDVISAASLRLYNIAGDNASWEMGAYRVLPANSAWFEGTQNWVEQVGASCWNKHTFNTINWAGSAGCSTSGTDWAAVALGTKTQNWSTVGWASITLVAAEIEKLRDGTYTNIGMLLKATTEGAANKLAIVASREYVPTLKPTLRITYGVASVTNGLRVEAGGTVNLRNNPHIVGSVSNAGTVNGEADVDEVEYIDGMVGIGIIAPAKQLEIAAISTAGAGDMTTGPTLRLNNTLQSSVWGDGGEEQLSAIEFYISDASTYGATVQAAIRIVSDRNGTAPLSQMTFWTHAGAAGYAERMRIDEAGYVGIGWTAPTTLFGILADDNVTTMTVKVNATQANANGTILDIRSTTGSEGTIALAAGGVVTYNAFIGSHYTQVVDRKNLEINMLLEVVDETPEWEPVLREKAKTVEVIDEYGTKTTSIIPAIYDQASPKERLFKTCICTTKGSKGAIGVYGGTDNFGRDMVFSIGAGFIIVANKGKDVDVGSYLISSDVMGCAELQDDDVYRASTVAKATQTVVWDKDEEKRTIKCIYLGG